MKITTLFLAFFLSLCACGGQEYALVSVSVTDMKEKPDYEAATVSQAILGTPVEVDSVQGYWQHVTTPEGYQGWVTDMNIAKKTDKEMKQWRSSDRVIVTDYFAVAYQSEDFESQVIGDAVMCGILQTDKSEYARNSIFQKVTFPDGREGYIEKRKIEPLDEWIGSRNATPEKIVGTAKKFLGFPYLWGGLSPKGLDCSGLVKISYFMNGLILRRDASQQVKTGKSVDCSAIWNSIAECYGQEGGQNEMSQNKENPKKSSRNEVNQMDVRNVKATGDLMAGDLLFFGTKTKTNPNPRVSHVGIYLGEGRFIHSSLVVRINSLFPSDADYYTSKSLLSATRILGSEDTDGIVSIKNHPWYF